MPFMKEFCFYCSVRLGSIIIGTVSIAIIPLCILLANGADNLRENAVYIQTHPKEYNKQDYFDMLLTYLRKDAETFIMFLSLIVAIYIVSCLMVIIGAYKLLKWFLWPYILLEFLRILVLFAAQIVGLVIMKDKIDLGVIIGITIVSGFGLLYLLYMWACVTALYQILAIVSTDNYKKLYGDDPLADETNSIVIGEKVDVENIKFYPSPDFTNYSPIKKHDEKSNSRLVTTISMTSATDIFQKDFNNLQNQMGSKNRVAGIIFSKDKGKF